MFFPTCTAYTAFLIRTLYLPNIFQGKGYMKTYWLKGKKDLSFKTPAELRYSSEQKDSEDKSSNGWVDKRRVSSQHQRITFLPYTWWTQDAPCWFSQSCAHCPLQHQTASKLKGCFRCFCLFEGVMLTTKKQNFHSDGTVHSGGYWSTTNNKTGWDKTGSTELQKPLLKIWL